MQHVDAHEPPRTFWDKLGMWLSYGCAIHCAAMPFLIGYLSLNGMGWLAEEATEWTIIAASLGIGLFRLFYSYFKEHRRPEAIVFFLVGVGLVFLTKSVFVGAEQHFEQAGMVAGGFLIGTAHFRNKAVSKCCPSH